jgi:uncharacterized protein YfiM (DUF2279 family)
VTRALLLAFTLALPVDFWLHAPISAGLTAGGYGGARWLRATHWQAVGVGVGLATVMGLSKEAWDATRPRNQWDWGDIAADVTGILTTVILTEAVRFAAKRRTK